jgi:phenylalanyl-tRNA synthetase alpha chain
MEELKKSLHEHEKLVLLALESGELSQEALAGKARLSPDSVAHACLWLHSKGLVDLKEDKEEFVELNEEGKSYLREGLPERQALNAVRNGAKTVKELSERLGEGKTRIALTWLMKRGLATIVSGRIELTPKGREALAKKTREEEVLARLAEKTSVKGIPDLALAEERGKILKRTQEIKRTVKLTAAGAKIVKTGLEAEKTVNVLTSQMIKSGDWKKTKFRPYDIKAKTPPIRIGKKQPYLELLDEAREYLFSIGFTEIRYPIIETEFWNFDALYQPQFHPARTPSDTYYIREPKKGELPEAYAAIVKATHENGWKTGSTGWRYKWDPEKAKKLLLRTHTTAATVRAMKEHGESPAKYFTISRNFRRDVIDATHLPEFFQCDGIIIQEEMNFRELLGMLKEFALRFAGTDKVSFRTAYFPYTEPSVELVAEHPKLGPLELGGAGMFRPEVRLPAGVKAEVMAWGLGFDRLSMIKLGLKDIRELFSHDLEWLEKARKN